MWRKRGKVLTVIKRVLDGGCGVVIRDKAERSRDNSVRVPSDIKSDIGPEEGETGGDISVGGLRACMTSSCSSSSSRISRSHS